MNDVFETDLDLNNVELEQSEQKSPSKRKKIGIIIFTLLLLVTIWIVQGYDNAYPDNKFLYNFKRLYEKTQLKLKSNPQDKLNYQYMLLDKRLEELAYITERGVSKYVLTTSLRYSTTAGQITEMIIENNMKEESQKAKEKLEGHLEIVKDLPQKYPKPGDEVKFIVDDANYLIIYINMLSSFSLN